MDLGDGMAIGGLALGFLGFVYKVTVDEGDKRKRIFERIDEIKTEAEKKFTNKEICMLMHKTISEDLDEIKKKTESIPDIKAGLDMLLKKNGISHSDG